MLLLKPRNTEQNQTLPVAVAEAKGLDQQVTLHDYDLKASALTA